MKRPPDYFYQQSAVVPYRWGEGGLEVMLITSRKKKRWVVPKGVREPELTPGDSAAKEAFEEAGIEGTVSARPVGRYQYDKWGGTCTVDVYTMEVIRQLDAWEEDFRDREWISPECAAMRVREADLKAIIRSLPAMLATC